MKISEEFINSISSREDFLTFLSMLTTSLTEYPEHWPNKDLGLYLDAMNSWTSDMDGYYQNRGIKLPQNIDWAVFARILMAAKTYE